MGVGWVTLLVGSRIDCWHTHTGLRKITDAGLKAFSAALGSSTSITTVELCGKYECLVTLLSMGPCVGVHPGVFGRCVDVMVCSVFVWEVHDEWMLAAGRTSRLLGRGCWVGGAPRWGSY